eukprot:g22245.t1
MKCFKRLIMAHINSSLPACRNPLQFGYQQNRKKGGGHTPIYINGAEVERVKSVKILGVTITDNLSWTSRVDTTVKKAQCLFFLRRLRKFGMSDCKKLQKVVYGAQFITQANVPSMDSIYISRCHRKAANIIKDPFHP